MKRLWLVVTALVGIHVVLTIVHYQFQEIPWLFRQIFDVDEEDSFPTWYSASALLLTATVLWVQANLTKSQRDPMAPAWRGLAVGFLFLSVDEIAGMHEMLNSVTEISWAVPGGVVAAVVGVVYGRFLLKLPRRIAVWFCVAGGIYVGGAVGIELLTEPFLINDALDTLPYNIWTAVEEGMEMGGVLLFLNALIGHMTNEAPETVLRIKLGR
ncbi:hypothetical protein [Synoicihabitans lomoniglobus]|uniref:Uncharacterized protein n=1 Tax=Synoicihabitans lomoniglobus TaxID=2909285 RepID=A0AAF0I4H0_9BACT|nr:hypothetical protein [Opitutaceae bacterium LMO-M01]WED66779.1 hypothetical protein PXH66_07945 [Opitutaceae bacterium LMO-M01]